MKKNKDRIYSGLRRRGYTHNQTIAIMANMEAESKFNPAEKQDVGSKKRGTYKRGEDTPDEEWFTKPKKWVGRGTGLIQWDDRRINLKKFADKKGKPWSDLDTQLDFLTHEKEKDPFEKKQFQKFMDIESEESDQRENIQNLTRSFADDVERAGKPHYLRRLKAADRLSEEYKEDKPLDMDDFLKHIHTRAKRNK